MGQPAAPTRTAVRIPKLALPVAAAALAMLGGVLAIRYSPRSLFFRVWSTSSELDGVYSVPSRWGDRPLEIRGSRAHWALSWGANPPEIVGREEGVLTFLSRNSARRVTYALVDGELWFGVMRRISGSSTGWYLLNELSGASSDGPRVASWDEASRRWSHIIPRDGEPSPPEVKADHRYWEVRSDDGADTIEPPSYGNWDRCLENANPCPHLRESGDPVPHGDVLIAPWSRSLGEVGVMSRPDLSSKILGLWSLDGKAGLEMIELVAAPPPRAGPMSASAIGPAPYVEPKRVEVPSGAGVFMTHWGVAHQMGSHSDPAATSVYVVLSERRILKRVRLSSCRRAGARLPDVFLQPVRD